MIDRTSSNLAIQAEIGNRLQRHRLNLNLSQDELAAQVGVSRRTIVNAENGKGCTLLNLIALLRGLNRLEQLESFLPYPPVSPIDLARLAGKRRRRASSPRSPSVEEPRTPWRWNE